MGRVFSDPLVSQFLALSAAKLFFVFGLLAVAVGVGLVFSIAHVRQASAVANRYVSTRHGGRWLAIPRTAWPLVMRHRYLFGTVSVVLGAYSVYILALQFDTGKVVDAFNAAHSPRNFVIWIVSSLRWFLVVGNLVAIVVGVLLIAAPARMKDIDAQSGTWYSVRRHTLGADTMHMGFDRWIEDHAKPVGWAIIAFGSFVVANYGMLLLPRA